MEALSEISQKIQAKPGNLLIPAAIFALLSPGVFITIPGESSWFQLSRNPINYKVLGVHSFLAGLLIALAREEFADQY